MTMEELLQQILTELQKANAPKLGLSNDDDGAVYIYCNRTNNCLWYTINDKKEPAPVQSKSLLGYVVKVEVVTVERRKKETPKLHVWVKADRRYCLEAGLDSHFSRSLINYLNVADLSQPVRISPRPGDSEEVLFCRVSQHGEVVYAPHDSSAEILDLITQVRMKLGIGEQTQAVYAEQPEAIPTTPTLAPTPKPQPPPQGGMIDVFKQGLMQSNTATDLIALATWMNQEPVSSGLFEIPQIKSWVLKQLSMKASACGMQREELTHFTNQEMQRLNWSTNEGRVYLLNEYRRRSRQDLTLGELLCFLGHLRNVDQPQLVNV